MKKVCFFLLLLVVFVIIVLYLNNPLQQAIRYGNRISKKIETLYNEKSQDLSIYNNIFREWEKEVSYSSNNTFYAIERDEENNWQYFTEDYEEIPFEFEDKFISEGVSSLFEEYDVKIIIIYDDSIWYHISEDALIYSDHDITDVQTSHIADNWYHFRFPYGI